jgi:hypothetical protein
MGTLSFSVYARNGEAKGKQHFRSERLRSYPKSSVQRYGV